MTIEATGELNFENPKLWETLDTGDDIQRGVFALQEVVRRSPRTGRAGTYQILRIRDWANVIALTPNLEVVLVAQYRHGTNSVTLEIPGGVLEAGEAGTDCAVRELAEETGFTGEAPLLLGSVHPNPAIQDNVCTTWLIRDARETTSQTQDEGEDIVVVTVPLADIPGLIRDGRISHSLVVAAFHFLHLRGLEAG